MTEAYTNIGWPVTGNPLAELKPGPESIDSRPINPADQRLAAMPEAMLDESLRSWALAARSEHEDSTHTPQIRQDNGEQ